MNMRSFDVDYETVDIEIVPANVFGPGVPADSIRLKVKKTVHHHPLIIATFAKHQQTFSSLF